MPRHREVQQYPTRPGDTTRRCTGIPRLKLTPRQMAYLDAISLGTADSYTPTQHAQLITEITRACALAGVTWGELFDRTGGNPLALYGLMMRGAKTAMRPARQDKIAVVIEDQQTRERMLRGALEMRRTMTGELVTVPERLAAGRGGRSARRGMTLLGDVDEPVAVEALRDDVVETAVEAQGGMPLGLPPGATVGKG